MSNYEDTIICPWCGYEYEDCWEYDFDSDGEEFECEECGKKFDVQEKITYEYKSTRHPCEGQCEEFELREPFYNCTNPYNHKGLNYTLWQCKICQREVIKTGEVKGEPYIIEVSDDDKINH